MPFYIKNEATANYLWLHLFCKLYIPLFQFCSKTPFEFNKTTNLYNSWIHTLFSRDKCLKFWGQQLLNSGFSTYKLIFSNVKNLVSKSETVVSYWTFFKFSLPRSVRIWKWVRSTWWKIVSEITSNSDFPVFKRERKVVFRACLKISILFSILSFTITSAKMYWFERFFLKNVCHSEKSRPLDFGTNRIWCFGNMRYCVPGTISSKCKVFWKILLKFRKLKIILKNNSETWKSRGTEVQTDIFNHGKNAIISFLSFTFDRHDDNNFIRANLKTILL